VHNTKSTKFLGQIPNPTLVKMIKVKNGPFVLLHKVFSSLEFHWIIILYRACTRTGFLFKVEIANDLLHIKNGNGYVTVLYKVFIEC
jgi:hypothetical protein